MSSVERSVSSRAELHWDGGLYPVPVPLGWKLIGPDSGEVPMPRGAGDPHHLVLARGALLATERVPGRPPEAMMLRRFALSGPPSARILPSYANLVVQGLMMQGLVARVVTQEIAPCALSPHPCAKLVFERASSNDDRREVHYLVLDRGGQSWELVYLLRRDNLDAWAPLLKEIDAPSSARRPSHVS